MKQYRIAVAAMLVGAALFTACMPASGSSRPANSGSSSASSSQPASSAAPSSAPSSQPQSSQPSSLPPDSSSQASSSQEEQEWAGTYAREPGSAGQVMLYITQNSADEFHFKFDAKGLIFEGDAVIAADTATYNDQEGYSLTFHLGREIVIEQTGTFEGGNVSFDGEFENVGR